ncbi:ABC transporter substrate-binding protein [Sedimenticola sp.]|uniref:ABC transporter substrate-binding protein n=1 Tax=Sedimenticola sp. TaxID=1940285 RepID=UPI003D0FA1A3
MNKLLCAVTVAAFAVANVAQAATPIKAPPLTEVLKGISVKQVRSSASITVPIITWGGDIATLVTNGNSLTTKPGSSFAKDGLNITLRREDVFSTQVKNYLQGNSPYLRGTLGMIQQASDVLCKIDSTCPKVVYQMTWSAGGDALVVAPGIATVSDLKGKRIAVQAYGPHVDYLTKVLADGGLSTNDVTLVWMRDLTGTEETPAEALLAGKADAATVIIPDALALTSGGNVGTGAEGSIRGAKVLLSTKTANRIIADVYAVRADYLRDNPEKVQAFVHALMLGQESLQKIVRTKGSGYTKTFRFAAEALLDSPNAVPDAEGLYGDAEFVGFKGNVDFLTSNNYPRRFTVLEKETRSAFQGLGLVKGPSILAKGSLDFNSLRQGLANTDAVVESRFNPDAVANVVTRKQQQDTLEDGELFSFEIFFSPNQKEFSTDLYAADFEKVTQLAATYGGAIITVEGHADPLEWLRMKKNGESPVVLAQQKQSARNLSLARAAEVRKSVITYANSKSVSLNPDQFALVPHGISKPRNGICGSDPCAPKNEKEWRNNMRVLFRIIQIEAEASVFRPL